MTITEWVAYCEEQLEKLMQENQDVLWRMGHEWQDDEKNS